MVNIENRNNGPATMRYFRQTIFSFTGLKAFPVFVLGFFLLPRSLDYLRKNYQVVSPDNIKDHLLPGSLTILSLMTVGALQISTYNVLQRHNNPSSSERELYQSIFNGVR
jgi:hypothetical protein